MTIFFESDGEFLSFILRYFAYAITQELFLVLQMSWKFLNKRHDAYGWLQTKQNGSSYFWEEFFFFFSNLQGSKNKNLIVDFRDRKDAVNTVANEDFF